MEELERAVCHFNTIEDFLSQPQAIEGYFSALLHTFGEHRINRSGFGRILEQLRGLLVRIPELRERLWEPLATENFDFEIHSSRAEGRDIRLDAWNRYVEEWKQRLRQELSGILPLEEEGGPNPHQLFDRHENRNSLIQKILSQALAKIARFEKEEWEKEERQRFFKSIRASRDLGGVASFFLYRHLARDTAVYRRLNSQDGDVVLDQLRELRENPRSVAVMPRFTGLSEPVLALIKDRIPPLKEFLDRMDLFPVRSGEHGTTDPSAKAFQYQFRTGRRRFHGIFLGMPTADCLAGAPGYEGSITELRWAVAALQGSFHQNIFHESNYLGSVLLTDIREVAEPGSHWFSLELACPLFVKRILAPDPSGELAHLPLFAFWLHEALARVFRLEPCNARGFVVGESARFDNARVLDDLRSSPIYAMGENLGKSEDYEIPDPLARIIPNWATREEAALGYPRRMLFDASADEGDLRALRDILGQKELKPR